VQRLSDWLASRSPLPPEALAARLAEAAGDRTFSDSSDLAPLLVTTALTLLQDIGDNRAAATDLLAADALITYAMEAAADDCDHIEDFAADSMGRIGHVFK
jgi:hypothetical protein